MRSGRARFRRQTRLGPGCVFLLAERSDFALCLDCQETTVYRARPRPQRAGSRLRFPCFQHASSSEAFRSITDGLGLRDGTGSAIPTGFGEAGAAAGAAPRMWAAFQAMISDSLK